jgi:pyrroloquinoline-quinone synthase
MLADFGARVIKVEHPKAGDPLRSWGPFAHGCSVWWKVVSRNKRSVTLNLSLPRGQEILCRLAERAEGELRETVTENLQEELHPAAPHPKLWRDFAASLGVEGAELDSTNTLPGVEALIRTYSDLAEKGSFAEAVAALYAYEAQVPEIAAQKIDGLRRFYNITEPGALRYFSVHQEADVRHRAAWRDWLAKQSAEDSEAAIAAAERSLKALWAALDAIYPQACATAN